MDPQKTNEAKPKSVGIIIPPSEIRKIADKTAEFVAKNGASFEELVIKAEANNPKFSFLKHDDPYRGYYDHKVAEFNKSLDSQPQKPIQEQSAPPINVPQIAKVVPNLNQNMSSSSTIQSIQTSQKDLKKELRTPQPDQFTVEHPANVGLLDIDIIKHTAQFVAKNGKNFLIALTEREKQNPQFDFLKPTHILFSFFTNLVDAYSKCIYVKKEEVMKLQANIQERMHVLNRALERFEYEYMQKQVRKKKEEIDEEERLQMAQIDWNDFIIVETIDLFENEELPAPHAFDKNLDKKPKIPIEFDDAKKPFVTPVPMMVPLNKSQPTPVPQSAQEQLIPLNIDINTNVKTNYVRKVGNADNTTVKCEVCGHNIPVNDYNEHLRIELMDPKHQIMKQELSQRVQNTATATGDEVTANLQIFSKKRPDIFGSVEDQFAKDDKQKKPAEKILWDGHSATMTRTTANVAMLQQQQKKNIEESLKIPSSSIKPEIIKPVVAAPPPPPTTPTPPPPPPVLPQVLPIIPPIPVQSNLNLNKTLIEDISAIDDKKLPIEKNVNFSDTFKNAGLGIATPTLPTPAAPIPTPIIPTNINNPTTIIKPVMSAAIDPSKMVREENVNLVPEEKWLELNPNLLQINIKIPDGGAEDNSWNFNGQIIQFELDPRTEIGRIKELLSGLLGGMPSAKQKLKSTLFSVLKDQHSLAYYNMINGLMLELSAKERGGKIRKK